MAPKGTLFVVSAPSGAGKTSLCRALVGEDSRLSYAVSYTTRAMRPGEVDGTDYSFVSREEFLKMVRAGAFVESAEVHGNFYGTSVARLDEIRSAGRDAIIDIDTQGAAQIRERYQEGVFVFILPPSLAVLEERLRGRKTDDDEEIERRIRNARDEISQYYAYDYVIVNKDFSVALDDLTSIVRADRVRTQRTDSAWLKETFEL